jgi:hypothetical protein
MRVTPWYRNPWAVVPLGLLGAVIAVAVALPGFLRACCQSPEASAIGYLRAINSAQSTFSSSCAADGYAATLGDLQRPPAGSTNGFLIPPSGPEQLGYVVTMRPAPDAYVVIPSSRTCNGAADPVSNYFAEAHPARPGEGRSFSTDARGSIYTSVSGRPLEPDDPEAKLYQ